MASLIKRGPVYYIQFMASGRARRVSTGTHSFQIAKEKLRQFESAQVPERVGDRPAMRRHVAAWEKQRNGSKVKANWQFTTADARVKLRKLYPTIDG